MASPCLPLWLSKATTQSMPVGVVKVVLLSLPTRSPPCSLVGLDFQVQGMDSTLEVSG